MIASARRSSSCLAAVLSCFLVASCATMQEGSDYYLATDFSKLHTYAWAAESPVVHSESGRVKISALTVRRVHEAIDRELGSKGYQLVTGGGADFGVSFTVGARDMITRVDYPPNYWTHTDWGVPYYWPNVDVAMYTEGTLGVDVFDNATHQPVWHGWAYKSINRRDIGDPQATVDAAVGAIFKSFPPK